MSFRPMLKSLFTGRDGETHDMGRWSWAGSFLAVVATAVMNVWHGTAVNVMELAGALGVVSGAHGITLAAKKETEPQPPLDAPSRPPSQLPKAEKEADAA